MVLFSEVQFATVNWKGERNPSQSEGGASCIVIVFFDVREILLRVFFSINKGCFVCKAGRNNNEKYPRSWSTLKVVLILLFALFSESLKLSPETVSPTFALSLYPMNFCWHLWKMLNFTSRTCDNHVPDLHYTSECQASLSKHLHTQISTFSSVSQ